MAAKRFASTSVDDIEQKRLKLNSENTLKSNTRAANILKEYLRENNTVEEFEECEKSELADLLQHFYVDIRKSDGELYKVTLLESIRSGLNRYLRSPPFNKPFDIVKDEEFKEANRNFSAMMAECKRAGLGNVNHHPTINEADRHKLYSSMHMSPNTPSGLYNKVQFDIRLYFCRRGCENMAAMTKKTFEVKNDPKTGQKYVAKTMDELTKNHREHDKENISGLMPESPDSPYCPVASYEKYISHLHPDTSRLWQKPKVAFVAEGSLWFCNSAVGEKNLKTFMSDLSRDTNLSQVYSNHSIRATGATILSKNMFGAAQIMAVTGHKSVQSLSVYQRVDEDEKLLMGKTLSNSLVETPAQLALPAPPTSTILALPAPSTSHATPPASTQLALPAASSTSQVAIPVNMSSPSVVDDVLAGIDLNDIFGDFQSVHSVQASSRQQATSFYGNVTIIHNLTINK